MKLTQEEKRIKIAEACGWKQRRIGSEIHVDSPDGKEIGWVFNAEKDCVVHMFPDYFTDLNAMHEAEKACMMQLGQSYAKKLRQVIDREAQTESPKGERHLRHTTWAYYCATAAQRAEALGLTLGLWEEGQ